MFKSARKIIIIFAACMPAVVAFADSGDATSRKLPSTLTLKYALSLADEFTPSLMVSESVVKDAEAYSMDVESGDDFRARLQAQAFYVDPSPIAYDQSTNDSRLGIILDKELYDFGAMAAKKKTASARLSSARNAFLDARAYRRMEILQSYFDVLLADIVFLQYNEEMAIEYIILDRLRARKELGKASDLEVVEQEQHYHKVRYLRTRSVNEQRRTRAKLAEVLNRPGQLPDELAEPELGMLNRKLPEYEELLKLAFENNYKIRSLKDMVVAAENDVAAARASDNPRLSGKIEAYEYSKELGSADSLRAGIVLEVPIYDGNRTDSHVARANAKLYRARANLQGAESKLRQAVLELWLELDSLRVKRDQVTAIQDFREMDLDHRRALYEMELKTDLGKGMALLTEAQFLVKQNDYKTALAWLKMDILTGQLDLENHPAGDPVVKERKIK